MEIKFIVNPEEHHIDQIKNWLFEEDQKDGSGFYCNWAIIVNFYVEKKLLIVVNENDYAVGFCCYQIFKRTGRVEILEVIPTARKQGVGNKFYEMIELIFIRKNIDVLKIDCSPSSSIPFWKRQGFQVFHKENRYSNHYFKDISKKKKLTCNDDVKIHLWAGEPYEVDENQPLRIIEVDDDNMLPIILLYNYDWLFGLSVNNEIVYREKLKRFNDKVYTEGFAIIREEDLLSFLN